MKSLFRSRLFSLALVSALCLISPLSRGVDLRVFNGSGDAVVLDDGTNSLLVPSGSHDLFGLPAGSFSVVSTNLGSLSFDLGTNHSRLMLSSASGSLVASVSEDPDRLLIPAPELTGFFFRGFVLILGPGLLFLFALRPLRRFFSSGI